MRSISKSFVLLLTIILVFSCQSKKEEKNEKNDVEIATLKSSFLNDFYIGAAVNDGHIDGTDTLGINLLKEQFNTITPENVMKWMYIHPQRDTFYFDTSDKYVALGNDNNMHVVGHALVWHSQLAEWMNQVKDSVEMATILKEHISTIVKQYKGKIDSWDVVNEALNEDGTLRESNFYNVMGDSYLELAFKEAAKADPDAQLVYNDYNLWKPEKRAGVVRLVKKLQESGAKIDGVGMQAHWSLLGPSIEDIEKSIIAYSELGVKVMFTELDVTALPNPWDLDGAAVEQSYEQFEGDPVMNPYSNGMPDSVQTKLAERYEDIFKLFLKHKDKISRVTFWGVQDGQSWLNSWPINGRTNHPLLFDRQYLPKKAYEAVIDLKEKN
jgi:endo-1,4-beta-xylanase